MEESELLNITEEDMNDSADRLKIDLEEDDIDPKSRSPKRKRRDTSDSSDDEETLPDNCLQIEEKVCKTAAKNHLSHSNVKNILKRVVSNEHVLAIVKLQEEEMQDAESATITRSKAKKLMKTTPAPSWSLPMTPVKLPQLTSPEVKSLIAQDLPDEESDEEEYQPNPDEHSDDENDTLGSLSDVDSQPRTPATPGQPNNEMAESPSTQWTEDGLFKLPKVVTPLKEKEVTTEATIALRTRSKLCLSDTPIEAIEDSFIPPDIPDDMYDFGLDHDWKNFLTDINKPLPQTHEDDDEADPEYNVDADKQTCEFDAAEELRQDRALKVTRKELKDLVAELFEFDDIFDVQEAVMAGPNSNLVPTMVPQSETIIHTNADYLGKFLDISKPQEFPKTPECPDKQLTIDEYNAQLSQESSGIQMASDLAVPNEDPASQLPLQINVGGESCQPEPNNQDYLLKPKIKKNTHIIMFNEEEWIYKESDANLEQMQRDILDQQMRQHVQIVTQSFLQLHGHPEYWHHGPQQLEYLMTLRYLGIDKENSAFHPCNLNNAIKLCEDWQAKLSEDTEEMRNMMKFIEEEIFKSKRRRSQHSFYACKFPSQFFDAIVDSDVFIYPELLPSIPFRVDQGNSIHYTYLESEDRLIALGLCEFYKYIAANKDLFPGKENGMHYRRVSELLTKYLIPTMTPARLKRHIKTMKNPKLPDNAIQYYFIHHKPPETKHQILSFGPHCTPRDHHKDLLPYLWRNILYPRIARKEATFRKAVGTVQPVKSFISNRNKYFDSLSEERGFSLIKHITLPSLNSATDLTDSRQRNPDSQTEDPDPPCWSKPSNCPPRKPKKSCDNSSDFISNSNIIVGDGSKIQIYHPDGEEFLRRFLLSKCQCGNNLLDQPVPKGQTRVTEFFSSARRENSSVVDNNTNNSKCDTGNSIAARLKKRISSGNRSDDSVNQSNTSLNSNETTPTKLILNTPQLKVCNPCRHPNGRFMRKDSAIKQKSSVVKEPDTPEPVTSYRDRVVLFKLERLISICKKRKAALTAEKKSKKYFKSHMLETISSKLAIQIKELENMLPSMPQLSLPSKENIDLSDDSNDMTVQPLLPDVLLSKGINDNMSPQHTGRQLDSATKKVPDDRPPMQARNVNKTTVGNTTPKHRLALKMQKELDANRAMFTTNRYADNLRDTLFATAYFERVQTRLNSGQEKNGPNVDSEQFLVFQNILDSFDLLKQTPCDLYYTLKKLFGSKNADLTEEFLAFLTAGQAAEIGRFMDHFLLISMAEFIERLQMYFARKPAQLRKVLWCLERLVEDVNNSENGEISMETVKSTILPHLKSSQYLVDWFLKLFPGEKPPESFANNGYEVLDIERMAKDYVEDQFSEDLDHEVLHVPPIEENYGNDSCTCTCHNSSDPKYQTRVRHCITCGMKYMQGRVYIQHGRGLRAAHVTWGEGEGDCSSGQIGVTANGMEMAAQARRLSAPAARVTRKRAASLDPPQTRTDSDDERVSPKRIPRFLRTPTSKNKFSKSIPCAKNLNKSLDIVEGSNVANKPSCSKSLMKDVENLDSAPSENVEKQDSENCTSALAENPECLDEALPEPSRDHEELTIVNDSDQQISLLASRLKGERRDSGYTDRSQMEPLDDCEKDHLDILTVSDRGPSMTVGAPNSVSGELCHQSETECDTSQIKQEPANDTFSNESMSSQSIKVEEECNWTRDEDKAILLVLQCANDTDNTFEKINALLPHRSMSEIRVRFLNVMQLLQQMALQPE